jgi:hypothetical protein
MKIYIYNHYHIWTDWALGQISFISNKCPVNACALIGKESASDADAVLFHDMFPRSRNLWSRPSHQVNTIIYYILYEFIKRVYLEFKMSILTNTNLNDFYSYGFCIFLRVHTTRN